MSGLFPPLWTPSDGSSDDYDESEEGPEALMWRSVASAANTLGYWQEQCPLCQGKGRVWLHDEGKWR